MSTEIEAYQQMTGFSEQQIGELSQPLDIKLIEHRPGGGGKQLAYITGKTAIETANAIFGYGKWGYRVVARSFEKSTNVDGTVTGFFYTADIELYVLGCPFPFPGEGIGIVVPFKSVITPDCHEKARKEAVTDALKRALRHYGDRFGLALYDEDSYVDAGGGTLVQVKDVKPGHQVSSQAKRVVEATPESAKPAQSGNLIALIKKVKSRAYALGLAKNAEEWHSFLQETIGEVLRDEELTLSLVAKINGKLTEMEKARKEQGAA